MHAPMRTVARSALTLGGLMMAAALLLTLVDAATGTRIEENRREARQATLRELAGVAVEMPSHGDVVACAENLVALALVEQGYGGAMNLVAAFRDERLAGIRVTRHAETPGFADILKPGNWISSLGAGEQEAAPDAVTGATVTANAVLRARDAALGRYAQGAPWCPP